MAKSSYMTIKSILYTVIVCLVIAFQPITLSGQEFQVKPVMYNLIGTPDASQMDLNYIDIPVILKYQVADKFNIGTGPQFSFLTSSSNEYEKNVQPDDDLTYFQESQLSWNTFDFGWTFEFTYNLWEARNGKGLNIHARYTLGLTDIIKDNPGDAVTNSVFQISASFPFIMDPKENDGS